MEFHIDMSDRQPDLGIVNAAICAIDPAAVIDVDASGQLLRVAAAIDSTELIALLGRSGFPEDARQVRQLPSIRCGGRSG